MNEPISIFHNSLPTFGVLHYRPFASQCQRKRNQVKDQQYLKQLLNSRREYPKLTDILPEDITHQQTH